MTIVIGRPGIIEEEGRIFLSTPVTLGSERTVLRFGLEEKYAGFMDPESADPFLLGMMIPAMSRGEDIIVQSNVSEKLFWNLKRLFQAAAISVLPKLRPVNVEAENVRPAVKRGVGIGAGFSAGVDSLSLLADHLYEADCAEYRLTHLLYFNVGSHGRGGKTQFYRRIEALKTLVDQIGLPFVTVDSNLDEFYQDKGLRFLNTSSPRNIAAALFLQKGIKRFLYACGFPYKSCHGGDSNEIAYADPIIVPLLATEALDTVCVGCDRTRFAKTVQITGIPASYSYLNVCVNNENAANCSTCWKCLRTELSLDVAGKLPMYKDVFSLEKYNDKKVFFMAEVLSSREPLLVDIKENAQRVGYRFPLRSRVYAALRLPAGRLMVKKMVNRLAGVPFLRFAYHLATGKRKQQAR